MFSAALWARMVSAITGPILIPTCARRSQARATRELREAIADGSTVRAKAPRASRSKRDRLMLRASARVLTCSAALRLNDTSSNLRRRAVMCGLYGPIVLHQLGKLCESEFPLTFGTFNQSSMDSVDNHQAVTLSLLGVMHASTSLLATGGGDDHCFA